MSTETFPRPGDDEYAPFYAGYISGVPDGDLLETLADPEDPDHKSSHVWASSQKGQRSKFDPEAFDEQQVKFANPAPRLKRLLAYLASQR